MPFVQVTGSPAWYHELHAQLLAGHQTRYGAVDAWQEQVSDDGRTVRLYVTFTPPPFGARVEERLASVCWLFDAADLAEWEREQAEKARNRR